MPSARPDHAVLRHAITQNQNSCWTAGRHFPDRRIEGSYAIDQLIAQRKNDITGLQTGLFGAAA